MKLFKDKLAGGIAFAIAVGVAVAGEAYFMAKSVEAGSTALRTECKRLGDQFAGLSKGESSGLVVGTTYIRAEGAGAGECAATVNGKVVAKTGKLGGADTAEFGGRLATIMSAARATSLVPPLRL